MTDEVLSSVGLSETIANLRDYLRRHPIEDYHLSIMFESLLAALQTYAIRETDEATACLEDEDDDLPPARLNS